MEESEVMKAVSLGLGGLVGYLLDLDWELLFIYLIMMMLDVIIAIVYEAGNGKYKSRTNCNGLHSKVGEFLTLLALILIQRVTIIAGVTVPFAPALISLFIFKELGSIFETLAMNDVELPKSVLKWYDRAKKELESEEQE